MRYLTKINVNNFRDGGEVLFTFSDGEVAKGNIQILKSCIFIGMTDHFNSYIFDQLGIDSSSKFVADIVGYSVLGGWPPVKDIHDLRMVLNALVRVNNPKFCNTSVPSARYPMHATPNSDKPTVNITIRSKHHSKLDFQL